MKRFGVVLAVFAGVVAIAPSGASAAPPPAPPGCTQVLTTPAVATGSSQGLAQKEAAYTRVCLS